MTDEIRSVGLAREVENPIDISRYYASAISLRGIITAYWREGGRGRMRSEFPIAYRALKGIRCARALRHAFRSSMAALNKGGIKGRAKRWISRRIDWVYKESVDVSPDPNMPLLG